MASKQTLHVISKQDVTHHINVPLPSPASQPPLAPSSIRARPFILGITSNNFAYASLGTPLHWWDAFPVPSNAPAPYSDASQWGIVPAWGYARVLESTLPDGLLPPGTLVWGLWPASDHVVDLRLELSPDDGAASGGHFVETSPHRAGLMPMYNQFEVARPGLSDDDMAWRSNVYPMFASGYLMHRFTFAEDAGLALHPDSVSAWSAEDADLSNSVVVVLSASARTARAFIWLLTQRTKNRPLALLQATVDATKSQFEPLSADVSSPSLKSRNVSFGDIASPETLAWVAEVGASRIVAIDFGATPGTVPALYDALREPSSPVPSSLKFTFVGVGGQPTSVTADDFAATAAADASAGRLQFNASPLREMGKQRLGTEAYLQHVEASFARWRQSWGPSQWQLSWGQGVEGERGLWKAWDDLCNGRMPRREAMVYKLP